MRLVTFLLMTLLQGCIVVQDKTNDPIAHSIVGSVFKTAKDGFLYEARCADIDAHFQSTEWCIGIQAFNSGNENFKTPLNYNKYLSSRQIWDKKLFTKLAFEHQRTIISPLSKGTIIRVTRMVQYPWGANGYYWALRAKIISGEYEGKEVELPTNTVFTFPVWLIGYGVQSPPVMNQEYLIRCNNEMCTFDG